MKKLKRSKIGRRQMVLLGLIAMIAVAGYINLHVPTQEEAVPATAMLELAQIDEQTRAEETEDTYVHARMERDSKRSEAMEVYRSLIESKESSAEVKKKAQADLSAAAKAIEDEAAIEGVLEAKGFANAIVYLSADDANVVCRQKELSPAQVAQVKDLVTERTGLSAEKIKIVEAD